MSRLTDYGLPNLWGDHLKKLIRGKRKMASVKEASKDAKTNETLNVADLDRFDINLELHDRVYNKSDGEEFTIQVVEVDGQDYRVPKSVLVQINNLRTNGKEFDFVNVIKSGTGMNTTYQVLPL